MSLSAANSASGSRPFAFQHQICTLSALLSRWHRDLVRDCLWRQDRRKPVLSFMEPNVRTLAYVDGYNFYYGRLQSPPYKWLDLHKLIAHVLRVQNPDFELVGVRYFTAPVLGSLATHGAKSVEAQNTYLRALENSGVEIIYGRHQLEPGRAPRFVPNTKADRTDTVAVWHLDEKETDVRLALTMYRDACQQRMDQVVLVSSDTDLRPALEAISQDFRLAVGVILPRHPAGRRPPAGSLSQLANWTRSHLLDEELAACQLPSRIPTSRKPILKPDYW